MSHTLFTQALRAGYERIVAWADILDEINVYPVPDGDTGRNLVITLGCLRDVEQASEDLKRRLLFEARGNSGNIAAVFLTGLLSCKELSCLSDAAGKGRNLAYQAVPDPKSGTILTLFDVLIESLNENPPLGGENGWVRAVVSDLENAVRLTKTQLPQLNSAGVVDAGALGMFVFFDAFLNTLAGKGQETSLSGFAQSLRHCLKLRGPRDVLNSEEYCLDVVLRVTHENQTALNQIMEMGNSVTAVSQGQCIKLHVHMNDTVKVREHLSSMGDIVNWSEDNILEQTKQFGEPRKHGAVHVMTDAAGSVSRKDAVNLGVTLLDSYIHIGDTCLPETYVDSEYLFKAMKKNVKVFTSQASIAERCACYSKVMGLHSRVLYLCVGSFYTGNWRSAVDWQAKNDPDGRMVILDTGLASGKLALLTRFAAELALSIDDVHQIAAHVKDVMGKVQEYIFLERLRHLAAGGRMSKTSAFVGDMLHLKPIVSPFPDGARKMGVVRNRKDQVRFAFDRLHEAFGKRRGGTLLIEYSDNDNREWVESEVMPAVVSCFPQVTVFLQPFSLTSAAHMGPGTWGIAFLPDS